MKSKPKCWLNCWALRSTDAKQKMKAKGRHPIEKLTALKVKRESNPGFYADGNGLYLKVDQSGAKRWIQRLVINGKRTDMGLGSVALVTLSEAEN